MMAVCLCACMRACVWVCVRACVWPSSTSSSTSRLLPQGSWGGAQLWGIAAADDVMLSRQQQWTLGYPICLISGHQHSVTWDRKAFPTASKNFTGPQLHWSYLADSVPIHSALQSSQIHFSHFRVIQKQGRIRCQHGHQMLTLDSTPSVFNSSC